AIETINMSDTEFEDVVFLISQIKVSDDLENKVLLQLIEVLDLHGKSDDSITESLKHINIVLSLLEHSNEEAIARLFNLIINDRTMPNSSYPTLRNYDTNVNYVDKSIGNEDAIKTIS